MESEQGRFTDLGFSGLSVQLAAIVCGGFPHSRSGSLDVVRCGLGFGVVCWVQLWWLWFLVVGNPAGPNAEWMKNLAVAELRGRLQVYSPVKSLLPASIVTKFRRNLKRCSDLHHHTMVMI